MKIFRVLGQICFFFYWFFDNISIVCKIKLFKGDYVKHGILASIFWLLSLLISIPVCGIQAIVNRKNKMFQKYMLDCVKYSCDILPASYDSHIFRRIFKIDLPIILVGVGGFISASISTYQNII